MDTVCIDEEADDFADQYDKEEVKKHQLSVITEEKTIGFRSSDSAFTTGFRSSNHPDSQQSAGIHFNENRESNSNPHSAENSLSV